MNKEFQTFALNEAGHKKASQISNAFDELLTRIVDTCPPGRELDIARTKLEEACFFARKAVASHPDNHE